MATQKLRVQFHSDGFCALLHDDGIKQAVHSAAEGILAATAPHTAHYQVVDGESGFGGGRCASFVESTDRAGYYLQAQQKVLEYAAASGGGSGE